MKELGRNIGDQRGHVLASPEARGGLAGESGISLSGYATVFSLFMSYVFAFVF